MVFRRRRRDQVLVFGVEFLRSSREGSQDQEVKDQSFWIHEFLCETCWWRTSSIPDCLGTEDFVHRFLVIVAIENLSALFTGLQTQFVTANGLGLQRVTATHCVRIAFDDVLKEHFDAIPSRRSRQERKT